MNLSPTPTERALKREIADLDQFAALATSIEHNAKGKALAQGLEVGFQEGGCTWRGRKGHHLHRIAPHAELSAASAGRQPVQRRESFSSMAPTRTTARNRFTLTWLRKHQGTDRVTGSRQPICARPSWIISARRAGS